MPPESAQVVQDTRLRASTGQDIAAEELLAVLYDELQLLAHQRMAKLPPGNTLDSAALVHEAYLRVAGKARRSWEGRRHFFFAAARAMHDILVEQARRKASKKRGGDCRRRRLSGMVLAFEKPPEDVLALHEALGALEQEDPDCAHTVKLRYFTGLTIEDTAVIMGCSESTIKRHWRFARAWLRRAMAVTGTPHRNPLGEA